MARRILNRKDLRADFEAAERHKKDDDDVEEEEEEEDEDEADGDGEVEAEAEEDAAEVDEDAEEEVVAPKKKRKAAAVKVKKPRKARTPKVTRMKVVWGVFNNSNQRVAVYEYPKRKQADEHAARLTGDKKSTHYVQPVKEPIEEKKED